MVNLKRYIGINQYRNISFHCSNRYNLQYEIDSVDIILCQFFMYFSVDIFVVLRYICGFIILG